MLKRTTSLLIIAFILGANITPLLSASQVCTMPCCSTTTSCCAGMENSEKMTCDMTMSSCETPVFYSVLSAPLVVQEHLVEMTIQPMTAGISPVVSSKWQRSPQDHHDDSGPDLFRTLPLII